MMSQATRNKQIIKLRERGWRDKEIAEKYSISATRVSQICTSAERGRIVRKRGPRKGRISPPETHVIRLPMMEVPIGKHLKSRKAGQRNGEKTPMRAISIPEDLVPVVISAVEMVFSAVALASRLEAKPGEVLKLLNVLSGATVGSRHAAKTPDRPEVGEYVASVEVSESA